MQLVQQCLPLIAGRTRLQGQGMRIIQEEGGKHGTQRFLHHPLWVDPCRRGGCF